MNIPINQTINPTKEQRHEMLKASLAMEGRSEDFEYIQSLLSPPKEISDIANPGSLKGARIGIIGGGLAGLSAAFELRKLGGDITIFDAEKNRIGGRVYTYYFNKEDYSEFGAARLPVSHETTWFYINLFNLTTLPMSINKSNNFIYVHNIRMRSNESVEMNLYPLYDLSPEEKKTPWPDLEHYAINSFLKQLPPDKRSQILRILPTYSEDFRPLINLSMREVLEKLYLSQGAIQLLSAISPFTGANLNSSYEEFAAEIYSVDYQNNYHILNGAVNLPLAFYHSFSDPCPSQYDPIPKDLLGSVEYKNGHRITGIHRSPFNDKIIPKIHEVQNGEKNSPDLTDLFDYVICAIPYSCLRSMEIRPYFSNSIMQGILELNYSDSLKSLSLCNDRFWEKDTAYGRIFGGASLTDLIIQSILYGRYDHTEVMKQKHNKDSGVLVSSYNYSLSSIRLSGLLKHQQLEVIKQNVERVHGLPSGYLDSIIEDFKLVDWNQEPNALGAYAMYLPRQKELFAYDMIQPEYRNRLYFAGEHVSTKHGWMQGALFSGKYAANQIARYVSNKPNASI